MMTFDDLIKTVAHHLHPETRRGKLFFAQGAVDHATNQTNIHIAPGCLLDLTGDLTVGAYTMIGRGTQVFTHDHYHQGRDVPLLELQKTMGVQWKSKTIGRDVWLHGCIVLFQVTEIPDGVVVGAGAVLTKNPGAYEIWAGNPAVKVGER